MNLFVRLGQSIHQFVILVVFSVLLLPILADAQSSQRPIPTDQIQKLVADFKNDARGPFQIVKWFCPDGSVIGARERCAEPGGQQRAIPKDIVQQLRVRNGIYLGQILAGTQNAAFLDEANWFSRLKQYQLEKYLARTDNGWIFREAQYYRGAYQAEDEEAWGETFLKETLASDNLVKTQFYLLREAARDIPHSKTDGTIQLSRSLSQEISDAYSAFLDIRVKIHGQPDKSDIQLVDQFRNEEAGDASPAIKAKINALYENLVRQYNPDYAKQFAGPLSRVRRATPIATDIREFDIATASASERAEFFADVMVRIRTDLLTYARPSERLALIDISLLSEMIVFQSVAEWPSATGNELIEKASVLREAVFGAGLLEAWEFQEQVGEDEAGSSAASISAAEFKAIAQRFLRAVEWSAATVAATYDETVLLFNNFEPLATGFVDDRIRSTVLLPFGDVVSKLGEAYAAHVGLANEALGFDASLTRGLNSGVALGVLEVITGDVDNIEFLSDHIYVMARVPSELKPVAGIATVTEGNMVSHVQLLARNLGIPNAVFPADLVAQLSRFSGQRVFYAVSPGGRVRLKKASDMSKEERALVEKQERDETLVRVPTNRLELDNLKLTSLFDLRATDSGRVCGPKAANLGQLSALFPDRVAPGFIVPFGRFRQHMDQTLPGSNKSYWQTLQDIFTLAAANRAKGVPANLVDNEVLASLAELRSAIEKMPLLPDFVSELQRRFGEEFSSPIGKVPVFVRSDTNMEDLKDFTGAGLNLTVPNVVTDDAIKDAIRRVWASPFRERGYRWRQKYLLNPADVYPSLLILKSVNVQKSGVMITTGVTSGKAGDYTVAFNRGVGGAVDGQAAESYLLPARLPDLLISPAREPQYTTLPNKGGIERRHTSFEARILTPADLAQLREIGQEVRSKLPGVPGIETAGPFDVELGFDRDKVILFQARPFVQNKNAGSISYLSAMDVIQPSVKQVNLDAPLRKATPAKR